MNRAWSTSVGIASAALLATTGVVCGTDPAAAQTAAPVAQMLDALYVAPPLPAAYAPGRFGGWTDANSDGCDTRADVLVAASTAPTDGGCPVTTGQWSSYLDGATLTAAADVVVAPTVPLHEAWVSGAATWTDAQRSAFLNDITWAPTLLVASVAIDRSRADLDPAGWMPADPWARCRYASDWVTTKLRWRLDVDASEKAALGTALRSCGNVTATVPEAAAVASSHAALEDYVRRVHEDLLGRPPALLAVLGWSEFLVEWHVDPSRVASNVAASAEFRAVEVSRSYRTYLGREPDPGGLEYWVAARTPGATFEEIDAGLAASDESYARSGADPQAWVLGLYHSALGRTPSAAEVQWWVAAMARGMNRGSVARAFVSSTEHLTSVVGRYYAQMLDRSPDPGGAAYWVSYLQRGHRDEDLITAIAASTEYRRGA